MIRVSISLMDKTIVFTILVVETGGSLVVIASVVVGDTSSLLMDLLVSMTHLTPGQLVEV